MSEKANESSHIQKYRKKLKKTLDHEKELINQEAINKTKASIHKWLNAHSKERINLQERGISLFDEKRHPAATQSKFILKLTKNLKKNSIKNKLTDNKFKAHKL